MSTPDLLYGETEQDLGDTVRKLVRQHCESADILRRVESDHPYDLDLWRRLAAELGVAGLLVPDELGGAGASQRELAVLAEELGRGVAPVPFLGSAVLATTALRDCATSAANEELRALAAGDSVATVAVPLTTPPDGEFPATVTTSGSGTLTGTVHTVVDLDVADSVVVPATDADGPALYLVRTSASGVTRTPRTPLDLTRRFGSLELSSVSGERVATGERAEQALRLCLSTGAAILASEQVGLAQHCLDSTVEYVRERYQFGRPVGSFQAVKHRLADLWAQVSTGRATARNAADALANADTRGNDECELAVALAQAYCGDLAVLAAEEALQLHGGIGMTWEHPIHLYLGRAKSSQLAFGIAERHRDAVAALVGLPSA